jgi:multisubunit Na+/H+ antiporter MnhF subunit
MAYAPRDYLYLLVAGIIVIVAALWLSALDIDTDIVLMLVGVCFGILVAGWLIGRNKS